MNKATKKLQNDGGIQVISGAVEDLYQWNTNLGAAGLEACPELDAHRTISLIPEVAASNTNGWKLSCHPALHEHTTTAKLLSAGFPHASDLPALRRAGPEFKQPPDPSRPECSEPGTHAWFRKHFERRSLFPELLLKSPVIPRQQLARASRRMGGLGQEALMEPTIRARAEQEPRGTR